MAVFVCGVLAGILLSSGVWMHLMTKEVERHIDEYGALLTQYDRLTAATIVYRKQYDQEFKEFQGAIGSALIEILQAHRNRELTS